MDAYNFRRYRRNGGILRLCLLGAGEFLGCRQLMLIERPMATLAFRQTHWGAQARKALK